MKVNKKQGITELIVPHGRGEITFAYPAVGPGTYAEVGKRITDIGLVRPTMAQIVSLVYDAWQTPENYFCKKVINLTHSRRDLLGFNGIRYVRDKGVFIVDLTENEIDIPGTEILEERIKQGDEQVKFVQFGYRTGYQTIPQLRKNPFIIQLLGKDDVKKLAEIEKRYKRKPLVWASDSNSMREDEITQIAAFGISGGGEGIQRVTSYFGETPCMGINIGSICPSNTGFAYGIVKEAA